MGQDSDVWPIALVLVAVLIPAVCLLWFMNAAMRNERFAARERLADVYRIQLSASRQGIEDYLNEMIVELEKLAAANPASAAFARCVESGLVDSVVLFDEEERILYPNQPAAPPTTAVDLEGKWAEASQLEHGRRDFVEASKTYGSLAATVTNVNQRARALQAQARCLVQAGRKDAAMRLVNQALGGKQYDSVVDPQGRLIVANAELMVLELIEDESSPAFGTTAQRLKQRLMDYQNPNLAAPQRRFLMKELEKRAGAEFPTLAAEELAAGWCEQARASNPGVSLTRASIGDTWQFATRNRRVVALMHTDTVVDRLNAIAGREAARGDATITIMPPGTQNARTFVSLSAGDRLPGWTLGLALNDAGVDAVTKHRTGIYFWSGILLVTAVIVLTLLAVRVLRRQTALARLKSDLVATVSHELKTPLASMRVLVDTLLNSEQLNAAKTREYLQLIAQENERLSRLIQNFLTFSRMERRKHTFHFEAAQPQEIIEAAVAATRDRFVAGCRLELEIAPGLPAVMADRDALTTALINLLDNAWKYSGEIKNIVVSARAENGAVLFSVRDNGIGIAPHERRQIFRSFYQIDQRLSRNGSGCGLGLSIVQFIAAAHEGKVTVESEPGRGSTFTIWIARTTMTALKEAVA